MEGTPAAAGSEEQAAAGSPDASPAEDPLAGKSAAGISRLTEQQLERLFQNLPMHGRKELADWCAQAAHSARARHKFVQRV